MNFHLLEIWKTWLNLEDLIWSCWMARNVCQIFSLQRRMSFTCVICGLPDTLKTLNFHVVSSVEALCILLRRLAYPCRYCNTIPRVGKSNIHSYLIKWSNVSFCLMQDLVIFFLYWNRLSFLQKNWLILQMLFTVKEFYLTTVGVSLMILLRFQWSCWRLD